MKAVLENLEETNRAPVVSQNGSVLLESEGYAIVQKMGIRVPRTVLVRDVKEAERVNLAAFSGTRVVVKVASPRILHKTEVGGVRIVARESSYVIGAIEDMQHRLAHPELAGFLVCEFIEYEPALGCELLLSVRWTSDYGALVFLAPGGTGAEYLSANLRPGRGMIVLTPQFSSEDDLRNALQDKTIVPIITGRMRGSRVRLSESELISLLQRTLVFASSHVPETISELEINPLVLTESGPVALDVLCRAGVPQPEAYPQRPIGKIQKLLLPKTIALAGVSEKMNPGRIILQNILRAGFPSDNVSVIKPGIEQIDGCKCVPDVESLPAPCDTLILSIDAKQVPHMIEQAVSAGKAESVILVSGGLGERDGTADLETHVRSVLAASRSSANGGPVLNGGNCLGIRSVPGKYDTLFIPSYKLHIPDADPSPLAVISQSGAYLVAAASKLSSVNPRYLISAGNQTDLTIGDYLEFLKDDKDIRVYACYVEGFRPMDGLKWVKAAREITNSGRTVLLYRAGRTAAGAAATASHTASIAGDFAVTREMARLAGAIVAETLSDFSDLMRLFCLLDGKAPGGMNLGAMSNAGFECVAMADRLGKFHLAKFSEFTRDRLQQLLHREKLDGVVDVKNPLDVTPILNDAGYEAAVRMMLDDEGVDAAIIGCVPMTGRLNTLPAGEGHAENVLSPDSVASILIRLFRETRKPCIVVVDGGPPYDVMATLLEKYGVPVFRSADRALPLFEIFCTARIS